MTVDKMPPPIYSDTPLPLLSTPAFRTGKVKIPPIDKSYI
jgi:hypothetical protein